MINAISNLIKNLRQLSQVNVHNSWRYNSQDLSIATATQSDRWLSLPLAATNEKEHIAWPAGRKVLWLVQQFSIPQDLHGYPLSGLSLRLVLAWWAEDALIFVNGRQVQQGDLFDCSMRVLLSPSVAPGEIINVALRLVSPGHDRGALVRSLCVYEPSNNDCIDPGFIADELEILQKYYFLGRNDLSSEQEQEKQSLLDKAGLKFLLETGGLESLLENAGLKFLLETGGLESLLEIGAIAASRSETIKDALSKLRQTLQSQIPSPQSKIFLLGHAHLDLAWLWPVSETWQVAKNTFASALNLMRDFPELTFCHSTAALYAWIEEHSLELFGAIKERIQENRWEALASLWVEPELNIISAESIVRQILYGQRYCQEKFGRTSPVAWLPDSFGFCWQLPQLLKQGGIEYFVTQKLRWNDTTQFPYDLFWWQSPDGTRILSFMSALIGKGIEPVEMADYAREWQTKTGIGDALWLPGVGDRGGGPTRDMLEIARRWQNSPFLPDLEFTTAAEYLRQLEEAGGPGAGEQGAGEQGAGEQISPSASSPMPPSPCPPASSDALPVWNDELYLEFHRGCYTSHADQKRWNRRCEGLLYEAELYSSLASLVAGTDYPQAELEEAWKKILFNQFHDILPGSSIPQVYVDANSSWRQVERMGTEILERGMEAIAAKVLEDKVLKNIAPENSRLLASALEARPLIIFNSLNWLRSEVVAIDLPAAAPSGKQWQVCDLEGQQLRSQLQGQMLLFRATDIPAIGYRLFWLVLVENDGSGLGGSGFVADGTDGGSGFVADVTDGTDGGSGFVTDGTDGGSGFVADVTDGGSGFVADGTDGTDGGSGFVTDGTDVADGGGLVRDVTEDASPLLMENECLRVEIDGETGNLSRVYDKINQREVLSGQGNQLQVFRDSGQYWDAWNIDPNYYQHPLPAPVVKEIKCLERGPIQWRSRVVRSLVKSEHELESESESTSFVQDFVQDYILEAGSPVLKIATTVDWQERHIMVKAAFPLQEEADYATYEMPGGAIERSTKPQTAAEKAKWEVPALHWADISSPDREDLTVSRPESNQESNQLSKQPSNQPSNLGYGVSLLNDCKYGYDAQPNQLRLTLLRGSTWPDPEADLGKHEFTYALYPHAGNWRSAHTVRRGYELNLPLRLLLGKTETKSPNQDINNQDINNQDINNKMLAASGTLLDLSAENLILMAFKQSEDDRDRWILRCYECCGGEAELTLRGDLGLAIVEPVDLLEQPAPMPEYLPENKTYQISPWKVASFALIESNSQISVI